MIELYRQEAERQRQLDMERRKFERLLAAASGAGFGIFVSIAGEIFRIIGGPTIIAQTLRTPGAAHALELSCHTRSVAVSCSMLQLGSAY